MPTTRLDIEYDGSRFRGWTAQPGSRTVQGELESALATVLREGIGLSVAGRTDAGVHAWGQVASFVSEVEPPAGLARSLNGVLPPDLAVTGAAAAPDGFDARRDARSRTYCYRVLARPFRSPFEQRRSLWWPGQLDLEALRSCSQALHGSHDFTAFTPTDTEHVHFQRTVLRAEWAWEDHRPVPARPAPPAHRSPFGLAGEEPAAVLCFWIEADAFMRNMVRALVGTMLEVGGGKRTVDEFSSLLEGEPRQRGGDTAPPHGLYLAAVRY